MTGKADDRLVVAYEAQWQMKQAAQRAREIEEKKG